MTTTHLGTEANVQPAHGVLLGAAVTMVVAARSTLQRAATPSEAELTHSDRAAASGTLIALVRLVADLGRRRWSRRAWWSRIRIWAKLERVRWLNGNPADTILALHVPLHADVPLLSPVGSPGVLHDPEWAPDIIHTVANCKHTMVKLRATLIVKHTLRVKREEAFESKSASPKRLHKV